MTHPPIPSKEFTLLMALLMSVVAISIDALLPALGIIGGELGVTSANQVQLIIGFIFAGMAIGQLIAGPFSDAIGRKPVLYAGMALYLCGSVFCYFAQDFNLLLVGRFIQGLGVASPYVTAISVVRDKYSGQDMARVMSLVMMIFMLVPAIAPSIGQAVMHFSGWRSIFMLYITYAIVIGLWIAVRLEETLPREQRMKLKLSAFAHGAKVVISNRTTLIYMICMGLCFGSFIGYLGASQQIFQEQFKVGDAFSIYFGALALVFGASSYANSYFVSRYPMRSICMGAMGAVVVMSGLFLAVHGIVAVVTLPMFLIYAGVVFFAFGMMFGNLNAIAMEPMGAVAGMASALIGSADSIISLALGTVIGQLYDNTLIPIVAGFLTLGSLSLALMWFERQWYMASQNAAPTPDLAV